VTTLASSSWLVVVAHPWISKLMVCHHLQQAKGVRLQQSLPRQLQAAPLQQAPPLPVAV